MKQFRFFVYRVKLFFKRLIKGYNWESVKEMDFQRAEQFYQENKENLQEMGLTFGFDNSIYCPIIELGQTVDTPICHIDVEGVKETILDVPCIFYQFKSGKRGKFYCYKEYFYDKEQCIRKYAAHMGIPYKIKKFGVFDPSKFEDKFHKFTSQYIT